MTKNRFVILHHLATAGEHWDLMLERDDALWTWQLSVEPVTREHCPIDCVRIPDHRKRYLDYQGPISGGRGVVQRVDRGTFELLSCSNDAVIFALAGERLTGRFHLARSHESTTHWILHAI